MDASVLDALIGLIGVAAGGGAACGGVVYQQRHGTRAADTARRRGEAVAAAERILAELLTTQQHLRQGFHDVAEDERQEYFRVLRRHHATVQLYAQWLPDAQLRDRLSTNALYVQIGPLGDQRSDAQRRVEGMALCTDSISCLGSYLRSEAVPHRDNSTSELLARWPEGREFHTFIFAERQSEGDLHGSSLD
ncbi:hypothetical protein NX794_34050 [Streptomyces sp. LP11]|uniref:Secreted protein n=1 Tax=Streptomyces pyxinicus TaxID=2970331 RepID=A0ABT2BCF7_9ACTN|nr:hypothetical protein [Streptomyces sp. LP11]MCS0606199.1 hypothetical protein [Streptomyces sp. LP11]